MKCLYCNYGETKVLDTRETEDSDTVRRRRECLKCKKRITTYERAEFVDLIIIKKDDTTEPFDKQKLLRGILKSCEKRPVSIEKIHKLVGEVEAEIRQMDSIEIPSRVVGELVMERLKKLDAVAYVRFASVYREFKDVKQFMKEIKRIKPKISVMR